MRIVLSHKFYKIKVPISRNNFIDDVFSCQRTYKEILQKEFPEYKDIDIGMPSDFIRRLGQSIAAASLPKLSKQWLSCVLFKKACCFKFTVNLLSENV